MDVVPLGENINRKGKGARCYHVRFSLRERSQQKSRQSIEQPEKERTGSMSGSLQ